MSAKTGLPVVSVIVIQQFSEFSNKHITVRTLSFHHEVKVVGHHGKSQKSAVGDEHQRHGDEVQDYAQLFVILIKKSIFKGQGAIVEKGFGTHEPFLVNRCHNQFLPNVKIVPQTHNKIRIIFIPLVYFSYD